MAPPLPTSCFDVFIACAQARHDGVLIRRAGAKDKEFHFQNWFQDRLASSGHAADLRGRNSYPDFTMVMEPEGYEVKALAYPGREASYDCNSQVPRGRHGARTIYYVFGRYPAGAEEAEYPVIDLVLCHGDFLNASHDYVHKNRSFRGFGSYGDILVRDRKMYVAPTPFVLARGTAGQATLIVPEDHPVDPRFAVVGWLVRTEASQVVVGYEFDLQTNEISARFAPNPEAGRQHAFVAYRLRSDRAQGRVEMAEAEEVLRLRDPVGEVDDEG